MRGGGDRAGVDEVEGAKQVAPDCTPLQPQQPCFYLLDTPGFEEGRLKQKHFQSSVLFDVSWFLQIGVSRTL